MSNDVPPREWDKLPFRDPEPILRKLWALEQSLADVEMDPKVRHLRANKLKKNREGRDGAIFAFGMAQVLSTKVFVVRGEDGDHDVMLSWVTDDTRHFCPVQLKELPSKKRNPNITLDSLLADLTDAYAPSEHTALAVLINGKRRIEEVHIPKLPFKQLWFFGACSEDQEHWFLFGDALKDAPKFTYFTYPR